jgi:UDP-N-acetylglucosamine pyrophosphorylase
MATKHHFTANSNQKHKLNKIHSNIKKEKLMQFLLMTSLANKFNLGSRSLQVPVAHTHQGGTNFSFLLQLQS